MSESSVCEDFTNAAFLNELILNVASDFERIIKSLNLETETKDINDLFS